MDVFNPAFWTFVASIAGIYAIMSLGLYVQFSLAGLPNENVGWTGGWLSLVSFEQ